MTDKPLQLGLAGLGTVGTGVFETLCRNHELLEARAQMRYAVKRVAVRGAFDCATLDGVADVHTEDETLTFLYSGDVHRLLAQLSDTAVTDVNITDPSLDEVFMHYYTKEETV